MLEYYHKSPFVSFDFVASPDLDEDIRGKRIVSERGSRRFWFYKRMMINLFGPDTFLQASDTTNTIYLLINKKELASGKIRIKDI